MFRQRLKLRDSINQDRSKPMRLANHFEQDQLIEEVY